jgi:hypothetical protein
LRGSERESKVAVVQADRIGGVWIHDRDEKKVVARLDINAASNIQKGSRERSKKGVAGFKLQMQCLVCD